MGSGMLRMLKIIHADGHLDVKKRAINHLLPGTMGDKGGTTPVIFCHTIIHLRLSIICEGV
jgi:hypothetical protein